MIKIIVLALVIAVGGSLLKSRADLWEIPKNTETKSPSGKFVLKVTPWGDGAGPGHCKAEFFEMKGEQRTPIWSRCLINNKAPFKMFVSDSGKYVLTMDEWGALGEFPIVVYGPYGYLIKVHSVETLKLEEDAYKDGARQIRRTTSSFWWSENSICFWGPNDETFFVVLHWGRILMINLRDGALMDEHWYNENKGVGVNQNEWKLLHEFGKQKAKELVLKMLSSKEDSERHTAAILAGKLDLREAIPALKVLLTDNTHRSFIHNRKPQTREFYIRKAAKASLDSMGESTEGVVIEEIEK